MKSLRSTGMSTAARTAARSSRLPPKRRCSVRTLMTLAPTADASVARPDDAAHARGTVGSQPRRVGDHGQRAPAGAGALDLGDHLDTVTGAEHRERVTGRRHPLHTGLQLAQRDVTLPECEVLTHAVEDLVENSGHQPRLSANVG